MVSSLSAVTVRSRAIKNKALFAITFPDDSKEYYGKEAAIHSISKQEYITSGYRVVEINIVTAGNGLLRIYHSRALQLGELQAAMTDGASAAGVPSSIQRSPVPPGVQQMADRASAVAEAMTSDTVMKEYPLATHARTIEYRVQGKRRHRRCSTSKAFIVLCRASKQCSRNWSIIRSNWNRRVRRARCKLKTYWRQCKLNIYCSSSKRYCDLIRGDGQWVWIST